MSKLLHDSYDKAVGKAKSDVAVDTRLKRPTQESRTRLEAAKAERAVARALADAPTALPAETVERIIGMLRAGAGA